MLVDRLIIRDAELPGGNFLASRSTLHIVLRRSTRCDAPILSMFLIVLIPGRRARRI